MPRITDERREARRSEIVAAARRCFARDGFHQTSMPDIAREAGMSAGAFYRYFPSKEDVILEIAGQAFGVMAGRIGAVGEGRPPAIGDIVAAVVGPMGGETITLPSGEVVPTEELARCGVQAWAEQLRVRFVVERPARPRPVAPLAQVDLEIGDDGQDAVRGDRGGPGPVGDRGDHLQPDPAARGPGEVHGVAAEIQDVLHVGRVEHRDGHVGERGLGGAGHRGRLRGRVVPDYR